VDKKAVLTDYIKKEIMHGKNVEVKPDDDLLQQGILDSLGILQLVAFIEQQFGIQVPDEGVVFENFFSVNALAAYLDTVEAVK
jgi:acyl carrier protein